MSARLILLAGALFPPNTPEPERVAQLSGYFSPRPGSMLELNAAEVRDLKQHRATDALRLRGVITVNPPRGHCLTITRDREETDDVVCARRKLNFSMNDLDRAGNLRWRVTVKDFGTEIKWTTPYRVLISTPFGKSLKDPPEYRFIKSCIAAITKTGRQIKLALFDGEIWTIHFPAKDELLPQPDPIPNLPLVVVDNSKTSVTEAADRNRAEEAKAAERAASGEAPPPTDEKAESESSDRERWGIPARDSYEMNGAGFQPRGSVAGKIKGRCRYNFVGPLEDQGTGRMECLDVDGFEHVFMPLTCLKDAGPKTK